MDLIKEKKDLASFIYDSLEGRKLTKELVEEAIDVYIEDAFESKQDRQEREDLDEEQDAFDRELNG